MTSWFRQIAFRGPASLQSLPQSFQGNANFLCPGRKALRSPTKRQSNCGSLVVVLLLASCPHAIAGFVVAVIILAFNGMPGRWCDSHILNKSLERCPPTVADCDASPTVFAVVYAVGVMASLDDTSPAVVFACLGLAVSPVPGTDQLAHETAAASCFSFQIAGHKDPDSPALAPAEPLAVSSVAACIPNDGQASKRPPGQVFHAGRENNRLHFSHDDAPNIRVARMAGQLQLAGRSHSTGKPCKI